MGNASQEVQFVMDKMTVGTTVMKDSVEQVSQLKDLITDVSTKKIYLYFTVMLVQMIRPTCITVLTRMV